MKGPAAKGQEEGTFEEGGTSPSTGVGTGQVTAHSHQTGHPESVHFTIQTLR